MTSSLMEQLKDIMMKLGPGKEKIVLVGERGVGKTWMAKKLSYQAVREEIFNFSIWIFMCRTYDSTALLESIARQMSLLVDSDEWEVADDNKEAGKKEENKEIQDILKKKLRERLERKTFLLVLDDEGRKMKEVDIKQELNSLLPPDRVGSYQILITSAVNIKDPIPGELKIDVKPSPNEELSSLWQNTLDAAVPSIKGLAEAFIEKCKSLPAAKIVIAKALNHFGKHDSGARLLEMAFEEADNDKNYNALRLLRNGYDLLPIGVLVDFCWQGDHVFRDRGVHYNELITYWILEGYLGQNYSMERAYEIGYHVVMELIDCQMLRELESGYVIMDEPVLNVCDSIQLGFHGTVTLGLATVFNSWWKGFGRITHKDGVVRTIFKDKEGKNVSTVLLDGNHFGEEVLNNFLESKEVRVLALFHPTLKELPSALSKMPNLDVLVLRGCDFLQKVDLTLDLQSLTVLEISGATSLTDFPNDFFKDMPQLRSLNLSELKIISLPPSLYDLVQLRWLILRGCSCLTEVGSLTKLENLVHLDLSYATSLESMKDKNFHRNQKLELLDLSKTKIRTLPLFKELRKLTHLLLSDCGDLDRLRSIAPLTSLQTLDLSGAKKFKEFHDLSLETAVSLKIINLSNTPVEVLPSDVSNPHHIFLKGCSKLTRLDCMESLKDLKVLDLSGSTELCEIEEGFFKNLSCLQELRLSETKVAILPPLSNLCNLRQLLLSRCESLKKLPELNSLTRLEVLDASGCMSLTNIPDKSFDGMSRLEVLNLSETKIEGLPPLPNPSNLRKLLLQKCTNLKQFPENITLSKLEELNLSGVSLSGENRAAYLEHMSNLQILDLSETLIEGLPPLSKLKNLKFLSLRGCEGLELVLDLETLTNLEVLDLSGTAVSQLQSLSSFKNLRQYHSSMKSLLDLKVTNLLGQTVAELPYGISNLAHLDLLELPSKKQNQGVDTSKSEKFQEGLNRQQWIISNWRAEVQTENDKHGISVSSTQFLELFEEDPSLLLTIFNQFHFLVRPIKQQKVNKFVHKNELIFRDIRLQAWQFVHPPERERSLEIHGFQNYPVGVDVLLLHAAVVYLIDNSFIKLLSDLLVHSIKKMKVCWIERCNNMECVMDAKKVEDMDILGDNLEIMLISNAPNLECIVRGDLQGNILKNLKCLYLDCCPKICNVFCLSQQFNNLEVLDIKFCDKLKTLSEESVTLPKLQTLRLWALPMLERVGCEVPNLQSLQVGECPLLETVVFSSHQPELLKVLHVKCCDRLKSVFEHSLSESIDGDRPTSSTLPILQELHLWELPVMKSIGVEWPTVKNCSVRECPKLQKIPQVQARSSSTSW